MAIPIKLVFITDYPTWFFLHGKFLSQYHLYFSRKNQISKLKAFSACVGTHDAQYKVRCPLKSCSVSPSTVLVPVLTIRTASNCWLSVLNVAIYNPWIVAYRGKVHAVVLSL